MRQQRSQNNPHQSSKLKPKNSNCLRFNSLATKMPCTAEQLVGDLKIPIRQSVMRHVTEKLYDAPINENSDTAHTSTLIAKAIASYTNNEEIDEDLLAAYQEEFEGWTLNNFSIAESEARKGLKLAL